VLSLKFEAAGKPGRLGGRARRSLAGMVTRRRRVASKSVLRIRTAARRRAWPSAARRRQVSSLGRLGIRTAGASPTELAAVRLERRVRAVELALDDLAAELRDPIVERKHYESAMSALASRLESAAARVAAELREVFPFGDKERIIEAADLGPSASDPSSPAMYLEDPYGLLGDGASAPRSRRPALVRGAPRS
jgi:hypothetical protein